MLWRHRQRRLEAEVVRDSILAVSGRLNTQMAGPGFYPTLPAAVLAGQSRAGPGLGQVRRARTSAAQHLYLRQAQPGSAGDRAARRARHHEQLRAANRLDDRAAGAGVPERGVHPRASAALRSAAGRGSREPARRPGGTRVCAGAVAAAAARRDPGLPPVPRETRAADQERDG